MTHGLATVCIRGQLTESRARLCATHHRGDTSTTHATYGPVCMIVATSGHKQPRMHHAIPATDWRRRACGCCTQSCPHAELSSAPRCARTETHTPRCRSRAWKASIAAHFGRSYRAARRAAAPPPPLLYGIRLTSTPVRRLARPGSKQAASTGRRKAASSSASASPSLTPPSRTYSTMSLLLRGGSAASAAHSPSRSASGSSTAVGTSRRRREASAACRDHASAGGGGASSSPMPSSAPKAAAVGATVETVTARGE
mmetsp:Transcript_3352/g.10737  ORF Transcript_3352/g.10737 Transcript_3352/m.10737 type:complete len:256 (+) Transcript_3352:399-1166(+)